MLAAVVTFLEMREKPAQQEVPASPLSLKRIENPQPDAYRTLFRQVGSPWLWFSRLVMDDAALAAIIQHPDVDLFAVVDEAGREVGMLELDFREVGRMRALLRRAGPGAVRPGTRPMAARRSGRPRLARDRRFESMCTPARSTIPPPFPPTGAPDSCPTGGRSSIFPTPASSASCLAIARLRSR